MTLKTLLMVIMIEIDPAYWDNDILKPALKCLEGV